MLEKRIYGLLVFGANHEFLERIASDIHSIFGENLILEKIDELLADLTELGLVVTFRASYKLRRFRDDLAKLSKDSKITKDQVKQLREIMGEIWPTLQAEASGKMAYIVSERRFPIEHLMANPSNLFAVGAFSKLPEMAKRDFSEATKCLSFERSTAAAFHMLRATESVLRHYYCQKMHRSRAQLMWGPICESMKKYPRRFPVPLLNHLDHIRSSFRNPTAHPEKIYDIDEAQDLLSICIDVANRMSLDLK